MTESTYRMVNITTRLPEVLKDLGDLFDKALQAGLAENPGCTPVLTKNVEIRPFIDTDTPWGDGDDPLECKAVEVFKNKRRDLLDRALNLRAIHLYHDKTGHGPPLRYMQELEASGLGRPTMVQIRFFVEEPA